MASTDDNMDRRPVLVVLPPEIRARVTRRDQRKDVLFSSTASYDFSVTFRKMLPFDPSWAPTADYVRIELMLRDDIYADVHYFAGTVSQLINHLRTHVPLAMISDVLVKLPESDDRSYIFILGAYEVARYSN